MKDWRFGGAKLGACSSARRRVKGMEDKFEVCSSSRFNESISDYAVPFGADVNARSEALSAWVDGEGQAFQFFRCHEGPVATRCRVTTYAGTTFEGNNFASHDYLGLCQDDRIRQAAIEAIATFGTHSAGSEPMGGGMRIGKLLEQELSNYTRFPNLVLFPTGWAAGYGALKALVRPGDHIVMDGLAHDCLQQGARAGTPNISFFAHNNVANAAKRIARARAASPSAAVFVVTESLFSMDSDAPDFKRLIEACREHGAYLVVDVAHDLGAVGPRGLGALEDDSVLSGIDCIVGSFSKTYASIGGFVGTRTRGTELYVRGFSGTYTFSNYLMPSQIAAVREALRIIRDPEGDLLRAKAINNAIVLRQALANKGVQVYGTPSPMVITRIGDERKARGVYLACLRNGLILNCIEYPACRRGEARLRLQVSPRHTHQQLIRAAEIIAAAIAGHDSTTSEVVSPASGANVTA